MDMEKCEVSPEVNPIRIVYQDADSVTFAVSQSWKGCQEEEEDDHTISWLATDFVGQHGELECSTVSNAVCGHVGMYTAQCEDGVSVVDIYAYDAGGAIFQSPEEKVFLPLACNAHGEPTKMCHFRYLLKCSPSLCNNDNNRDHHDNDDPAAESNDTEVSTGRRALRA